ncbi:acetyltransferase [Pseudobdellovibrio exovorus]|nr:acetyltransferase [Pseudobdellovibrio exovorus]
MSNLKDSIIIFGTGGHAKVVFDILMATGCKERIIFCSKDESKQEFLGCIHVFQDNFSSLNVDTGIVAIGDNWIRSQVVNFVRTTNPKFKFIKAIHPRSCISNSVALGDGVVVMAGAVINPDVRVGMHVIVNTASSVDHDCILEDFSSLAPGATLGGNVAIGEYSAISLGAKVIHGRTIGRHTVIGAGATVLHDIESEVVAYGSPCRSVKRRIKGEKYL